MTQTLPEGTVWDGFMANGAYYKSPKAPAPGWAVDSYKMVIVNKRESRFLDIKYS